jgi:hypothetical protein
MAPQKRGGGSEYPHTLSPPPKCMHGSSTKTLLPGRSRVKTLRMFTDTFLTFYPSVVQSDPHQFIVSRLLIDSVAKRQSDICIFHSFISSYLYDAHFDFSSCYASAVSMNECSPQPSPMRRFRKNLGLFHIEERPIIVVDGEKYPLNLDLIESAKVRYILQLLSLSVKMRQGH